MKIRYFVMTAILLLMAVVPAMSNAQVTQNGLLEVGGVSWYGINSTVQVAPGDTYAPLYLTYYNEAGTVTNLTVNVALNGSSVFQYSYINGSSSVITESIPYSTAGSSYVLVQPLNVSGKASPGLYTLLLHYSFISNGTAVTGNTSFVVPVLGSINIVGTQSLFGTENTPLIGTPGMKNVPLTVVLENTGSSPVTNISVSYSPGSPLYGVSQNTYISAMSSYGYSVLTFTVSISSGIQDGIYSQKLTVSYSNMTRNVEFSVPVTGYSNISMISYYTNPPVIYQGAKFIQLTAVLVNSGNSFASNVNITAESSAFSVISKGYTIPYMPSGNIFNATFLVNAPSVSGTSTIQISTGSITYSLDFYIHSKGSLKVTSSIPAMRASQNDVVETFNVTNTGNATISDLSMYLITPSVISLHISSSNPLGALTAGNFTIGQLNPGQSFTVTFEVDVSSSAASGTYSAQLFMTYMMNESAMKFTHTYNFQNSVQPTSIQTFENFINVSIAEFAVLILIIVIVVSVVGIAARSRRKKGKR